MRVLRIEGRGGPEVLKLADAEPPVPQGAELLVGVHATAVNRADLLQVMGLYPAPPGVPADVPGLEFAGVVLSVGPEAQRYRPGDRVMGIVGGGAFRDQLTVDERTVVPVPAKLSFEQAAAIPEVFFTAYDALFLQGGLQPGHATLVHAAGSGVGTAAIQLARRAGVTVLGTARSDEKLARCQALGLDHGLKVESGLPQFADWVMERTRGIGVSVALELAGGDYVPETVRSLAVGGRLLLVGLVAGSWADLDLGRMLTRRLHLIGTTLRSRTVTEKALLARAFEEAVLPGFEDGSLRPVVDQVLPFEEAATALRRLQSNATFGKCVLSLSGAA